MSLNINSKLKKEVCSVCIKNISIGSVSAVCHECDKICHIKCSKKASYRCFRGKLYCPSCLIANDIIRYNPFYDILEGENDKFFEDEPAEYIKSIQDLSEILENCKDYSKKSFSDLIVQTNAELTENNFIFSTYFLNIDGNNTNFDQLSSELSMLSHKFSIVAIAETNTDQCNKDQFTLSNDYTSVYSPRIEDKAKGSGLALYVLNDLKFDPIEEFSYCNENIESIFIKITNTTNTITVGAIYRPPSGNIETFNNEMEQLLTKLPDKNCYLLGDYNINLLDLKAKKHAEYEGIVISNGYTPLISIATNHQPGCKKTCIDNIITNQKPENILATGKIDGKITSHSGIFQISKVQNNSQPDKNNKNKIKIEYDYNSENLKQFTKSLKLKLEQESSVSESFETFSKVFQTSLDETCKLTIPKTTKRNTINNPWITTGIIKSIEKNDELYRNWIESFKVHENGDEKLKCIHKEHQSKLRWLIKAAKSKHFYNKFEKFQGDKKKTWKIINELRGKQKQNINTSFYIGNERIISRRVIADKFNTYFATLASNLNDTAYHDIPITGFPSFESFMSKSCETSIFLEDCDEFEVLSIINELQNGKSSDIPITVVKSACNIISPYLSKLYNEQIASGIFPQILKTSKITPIYKKGNKELIENYRPVSTLPIFGKIFEKIIYSRLYKFLTYKQILLDSQFGFRKGHSTSHALHYSSNIIKQELVNKNHVLGIFIDLSKAFDTLDHRILLRKLENCGIRGVANDLLKSYLSDRTQYTCFLGEKSTLQPIIYGVPQGSVLGPLLFLIYINDIVNCIDASVKLVLYADDTNIFITDKDKNNLIQKANTVLKRVNDYMKSNLLHINVDKCCYMHFDPRSNHKEADTDEEEIALQINGVIIPEVESTKFLGVMIDNKLTWIPQIESLHKKLKSSTGMLRRMRDFIPKENYKTLYYALFESHLTYCITVFGHVAKIHSERLFTVQKHCIRILFGDQVAYKNKYKTCARTRPFDSQILGAEFYCKEHTKPIFHKLGILTFYNLYNYQLCIDTLKTIQSRTPNCLYMLYSISSRKNSTLLLHTNIVKGTYLSNRVNTWNNCIKLIAKSEIIHDIKISKFKKDAKAALLKIQNSFDDTEWYHHLNFSFK